LALEKKAEKVKILDLRKLTDVADYFVICSAEVDVQIKSIADNISEGLKKQDVKLWHLEGYSALNWVLLDYVTVVVHIFKEEARSYYDLEKLWGDAPVEQIAD
jgi:ribosome-associated protein